MPASQQQAEMIELRNAGVTLQEIGRRYGVTRQRVHQLTKDHVSRQSAQDARVAAILAQIEAVGDDIRTAHRAGLGVERIAHEFNFPVLYVKNWLRENLTDDDRHEHQFAVGAQNTGKWTERELLGYVQRAAGIIGRTPGMHSYRELRESGELGDEAPNVMTIIFRFRTWQAAVVAAGLEPNDRPTGFGTKKYASGSITQAIARIRDKIGHVPSVREYEENAEPGEPSAGLGRYYHGNWRGACRKANEEYPNSAMAGKGRTDG